MADVTCSWTQLRDNAVGKTITNRIQWIDLDGAYYIALPDGSFTLRTRVRKASPRTTDQVDFEDNYQSNANQVINANTIVDGIDPTQSPAKVNPDRSLCVSDVDGSNPGATPGCPTIGKKLRTFNTETDATASSSYSTLWTRSGSGKLFGFAIDYNSDYVWVKLTIDGEAEPAFEVTLQQVEDMQAYSGGGCDDSSSTTMGICGFFKKASGNKFYFCPPCPIAYETSVLIEHKRSSGSNKTATRHWVIYTEET